MQSLTAVPVFHFKTGNHYNSLKTHCFSPTGMIGRREDPAAPPLPSLMHAPPPPLTAPRVGGG